MAALDNLPEFCDWCKSEKGKEFFTDISKKIEVKYERAKKAHDYIETLNDNELDSLINRIISVYTEEYINRFLDSGHEPHPTNLTMLLFTVADEYGEEYEEILDDFDANFGRTSMIYRGYVFNYIDGQGTLLRIFKDDNQIIMI